MILVPDNSDATTKAPTAVASTRPAAAQLSPSAFLRARRPERFSDTVRDDAPVLDRAELEYHLATITGKKQEAAFETLARHLAERAICPNLSPQTGPTGGGDSKTDAETFPVAASLTCAWVVGDGSSAGERWAFAFSAKKRWKPKLESDIAKIAATGRGYAKAFFVTNQMVSDRKKAELQDALSAKHAIDVRVLDLVWIVDQLFSRRLEALAIEDLGIPTSRRQVVLVGPRDLERERKFKAAEEAVTSAVAATRITLGTVDTALDAALFARDLERPRTEIDGLFARATRLATTFGSDHQRLEVAYQRAWTAFWFYEDYDTYLTEYRAFESAVRGTRSTHRLDQLVTLWMAMHSAATSGQAGNLAASLGRHTRVLLAELRRMASQPEQPSSAIGAKLSAGFIQVLREPSKAAQAFDQLRPLVAEAACRIGYPFDTLIELVDILGETFSDVPEFQTFVDAVEAAAAARAGEMASGRVLLSRGARLLDARRPYEAIRALGTALRSLYRHESRDDALRALYICAVAYERVGLLWAARGTLANAASLAFAEFREAGTRSTIQALCAARLKWIELHLGRLAPALEWHELHRLLVTALGNDGHDTERLLAGEEAFDMAVGVLLLRTPLNSLRGLSLLPDVLDRLDLYRAATALLYALGQEDAIPAEALSVLGVGTERTGFFHLWRDQPLIRDLRGLETGTGATMQLASTILGCHVTINVDMTPMALRFAESLIAALESFLSTSTLARAIAAEPELTIRVVETEFGTSPFGFRSEDRDGRPYVHVHVRPLDPSALSADDQHALKERMSDLLAEMSGRILILGDLDAFAEQVVGNERGLERAVHFTGSLVTIGNVLGAHSKDSIRAWWAKSDRDFPLRREEPWDTGLPAPIATAHSGGDTQHRPDTLRPAPPYAAIPSELADVEARAHTDFHIISPLRLTLWDAAKWRGTGYQTAPEGPDGEPDARLDVGHLVPLMAFIFHNPVPAADIFRLLIDDIADENGYDEDDEFQITIIRGIRASRPHAYNVAVSGNPFIGLAQPNHEHAMIAVRWCGMDADTPDNLDRFLRAYERVGCYGSSAGVAGGELFKPDLRHVLMKRHLHVRDAWTIGPHDLVSVAIGEDDDPIIPEDQLDAPVRHVLKRRRRQGS